MTQEELKRLHIINKVLDKAIKQFEAAELMGVCTRQVRRIVKAVRREGERGIIHKSRGRVSNKAISVKVKEEVLELYQKKYHDFGPTLGSEKLFEIDKIKISDETLRLWLIGAEILYQTRKKGLHRQWRRRKESFGQMIQMDGSHHNWFEGRGEKCVLMGYIDDATGKPFGRFYAYEGTMPAMDSFKQYIRKYGIPISVYLEKHSTYKSTEKETIEDQLNNVKPLSQFARALKELGVEVIYANSPQAKGRIERLFRTFQNRLLKEMRLRGIKTIDEGNKFLKEYLPVYAKRFAVKPSNEINLHRAIPKGLKLDTILCVKTKRVLRNDFTIAYEGKLYQVKDNLRAREVIVEERIDGVMSLTHKGVNLRFKEITTRPEKKQHSKFQRSASKKIYIPSKNHPWRKFRFTRAIEFKEKEDFLRNGF